MRIFGIVLLVIGILLMCLFPILIFTSDMSAAALFFPLLLISMGWRFSRWGRGIVRDAPSSSPPAAQGTGAAQAPAVGTVEIPMSPQATDVIVRQCAQAKKMVWWIAGGALVLFIGLGALFVNSGSTDPDAHNMIYVFGGMGFALAFLVGGFQWLLIIRPIQNDLAATTYLRTTGPIQLVFIRNGYMLRLADRSFLLKSKDGVNQLKTIDWGTVDHSQQGHVLLAAWDRQGNSVYIAPGSVAGSL